MSAANVIVNLVGITLTSADYAALEKRWITPELADAAQLRRVDCFTGRDVVGQKNGDFAGIVIPYFHPDEPDRVREYRLRRDNPEMERQGDGTKKPKRKYVSPPGRGNMLYLPPGVTRAMLSDPELALVITEGEFKTVALWRLANHESDDGPRFVPVGLSGVWNWRGTIGRETGPNGNIVQIKGPIPDLDWIVWKNRRVIIAFDADLGSRSGVKTARAELQRELIRREALVGVLEWDEKAGKGIDDHLAAVGPETVLKELAAVRLGEWRDRLITTDRGAIKAILANAITALREAPQWSGVLAFDQFSLGTVALKPPPWTGAKCGPFTDQEDRLTTDWLHHAGICVSLEVAGQAIQTVAQDRPFHPVRAYLQTLEWDGIPRIDSWLSLYFGCDRTNYVSGIGSRWLISAVARIFQPGCESDCVLILEGVQGSFKSTALRILGGEWFTDELAEPGSKDAAMQTRGVWIIEISELDSIAGADVGAIKAFISRSTDRFRPPYGKRLIESPRQCVFAGSVNHSTYLRDETGGRRFWPVKVGCILIDHLAEDRDQIWAEAYERYREGAKWWLDSVELNQAAEEEQLDRYVGDVWDQVIAKFVYGRTEVSIAAILEFALDKPKGQWTQVDQNRVSRILITLGWEKFHPSRDGKREWRWRKREEK